MTEKESRIINKVWPKVASVAWHLNITGEDAILAMIRVIYAVLEEEE
jgi:hypothetical protein